MQRIERDATYRHHRFPGEVIETCVRWYVTYRLSDRDLVALLAEWDVHVSYTTLMRWVLRCVPEYERRRKRRAKPVGSPWRVDETYIKTRPKADYLCRAVDKQGKTVDSLFQVGRRIAAAMAFFLKAHASGVPRWPRKITLDGHRRNHLRLRGFRREDHRWKYVLVRTCQYLTISSSKTTGQSRAAAGRCRASSPTRPRQ